MQGALAELEVLAGVEGDRENTSDLLVHPKHENTATRSGWRCSVQQIVSGVEDGSIS
jgi:hypothetical protein